jgi:hypothetical protein
MAPAKSVALKRSSNTESDDLFPNVAASQEPMKRPKPLRACVVCGVQNVVRAHADHAVCIVCVTAPADARQRLEAQRQAVIRQQQICARAAQAAYNALSDEERARWSAYALVRAQRDAGQPLSDSDLRRLRITTTAYRTPDHPRITDALRRMFEADEALFWANAANEGRQKQINSQLAALAVCLEDMGMQSDADALYAPHPHVPAPTTEALEAIHNVRH